jgi:hypothetical protein
MVKRKKQIKGQMIFDHLWGIPGGLKIEDLALLRFEKLMHE